MKLLEYEAKAILKKHHLPLPKGTIIQKGITPEFPLPAVIKSQVPVGGRGKAGGIIVVSKSTDIIPTIDTLFQLTIKNHTPRVLLAEEVIPIKNELYLALLIDRDVQEIQLLAHKQGGMEVEANHEGFLRLPLTKASLPECSKKLAAFFNCNVKLLTPLLKSMFTALVTSDATLIEINPLIATPNGVLICGDCKMEIDNAALYRHPELKNHENPDSNFVRLDKNGTVATIANGAGLAMATVDAVAGIGMKPANFLDIGGGATTNSVLGAFEKIMEFPRIEAIIVNIFAGITRCDEIARAIIEAKQAIPHLPPLFIRLAGTNFEEAVAILTQHDIPTLSTLEECVAAVKGVVHE